MKCNEQQRAIIDAAGSAVVFAAAGTGKTFTLIEKVAALIDGQGVAPGRVLILTFTRRAADDFRRRLASRIGPRSAREAWVGTFHAISRRLLRTYAGDRSIVIDEAAADVLLAMAARQCGLLYTDAKGKAKWRKGLSVNLCKLALDEFYRTGLFPADLLPREPDLIGVYRSLMLASDAISFDEILKRTNDLLASKEGEPIRSLFDYVFVDELQDTDRVQYALHEHFKASSQFVGVGDFRQSIYAWRGAEPDLVFSKLEGIERFDLTQSWRCPVPVIALANALIGHDPGRTHTPMASATDKPGRVFKMTGRHADVVAAVRAAHDVHGFAWEDIAILSRDHRSLERLAGILEAGQIPHYKIGTWQRMLARFGARLLMLILRIVENKNDRSAMIQAATMFGWPTESTDPLLVESAESRRDAFMAGIVLHSPELGGLNRYLHDAWAEPDAERIIGEHLQGLVDRLPISPELYATSDALRESCQWATFADAASWLASLEHDADADHARAAKAVQLCTAHASKGLEWPCVFVVNLNDGTFPTNRGIGKDDGAEERRLLYVAITRASEMLTLHWRRSEDQERKQPAGPSRFLGEMPMEVVPWLSTNP